MCMCVCGQLAQASQYKMENLAAYKARTRVVLARQNKREDWCLGVAIKPETREHRRAAAEWPRKVLVLWPFHNDAAEAGTVWGMCGKEDVKDATDEAVEHFAAGFKGRERALMHMNLQWCRGYVTVIFCFVCAPHRHTHTHAHTHTHTHTHARVCMHTHSTHTPVHTQTACCSVYACIHTPRTRLCTRRQHVEVSRP